jgi:hypothetical protein
MDTTKKRLLDGLYDFQSYLGLEEQWEFKLVSFGSSNELMQSAGERSIQFNQDFLQKSSLDFTFLVFIHEAYHAIKQGVVDKSQVNTIRDSVGWLVMQLLDVEADLITAKYLKERHLFSLLDYLFIHQKGAQLFINSTPRRPKFERFIGTMLSVHRLYQHQEEAIYLPNLSIPFTVVLIKQTQGINFYTERSDENLELINNFRKLYSNQHQIPFTDFYSKLRDYIEYFQNLFPL